MGNPTTTSRKTPTKHYRTTEKSNFVHEHVWDVVKKSPKWLGVPPPDTTQSSKQTKTSGSTTQSDAQTRTIDLNDPQSEDENTVEFEEPRRPIGKKKGKRTVCSSSSTGSKEVIEKLATDMAAFQTRFEDFNTQLTMDNKKKNELRELKELRKASEYLLKSEEGLPGVELEILRMTKNKIREKWGFDN